MGNLIAKPMEYLTRMNVLIISRLRHMLLQTFGAGHYKAFMIMNADTDLMHAHNSVTGTVLHCLYTVVLLIYQSLTALA